MIGGSKRVVTSQSFRGRNTDVNLSSPRSATTFAELALSWEKMALDIGDIVWQEPFVCPRVLRYFPARYRLISTLRPMFRSSLYVSSTGVI